MTTPTIRAFGTIPEYACVKMTTTPGFVAVATAATDTIFGVNGPIQALNGEPVELQADETDYVTMLAGGTITSGSLLVPTTGGAVVSSTVGQFIATSSSTSGRTFSSKVNKTITSSTNLNFLATGTGAQTVSVNSKLAQTISVKDFGAVGDGVTDDTVAIQAALTAGAGKSVFVPDGTYVLTSELIVSDSTCLYGNPGAAVLKVLPTSNPATFNNGLRLQGSNITIQGITVEGTNEFSLVGGARTEYASGILTNPSLGPFTNINILNCGINKWGWGIWINRVSYFRVIGNRCWGGEQTSVTVPVPDQTTFDISAYTTASVTIGGIIANNFALGNVDTGIGTSAVIGEQGIVITGNVVTPRQSDGVTPVVTANLRTRYGIHTGYTGTLPVRATVSNNYVQDYRINGIYVFGNTMPSGDVTISGNVVYQCGGDTLDPAFSSLKGGIWVKGGADSISGNVVVDCYRVGIEVTTLQVTPSPGVQRPRCVVANNNIARIVNDPITGSDSGFGILLTGYDNSRILISGNRIQNTVHRSIDSIVITNNADNGGIHIVGNLVEVTHDKGAIFLNQGGASVSHSSVVGNHIVGNDNVTSNASYNSGIWFNGKVHCMSNTIRNFYRGITGAFLTTRVLDVQCSGNAIYNCRDGISAWGGGPWIVSDNVFSGTTNDDLHAGAYQGAIVRSTGSGQPTVIHTVGNAAPTTDTWARGDYVKNATPTVGQPKGWYCTVAGTPGTWVSEGNL
jgi:hypothetical protein